MRTEDLTINKTVDARGLACPLPVVNAKKAVQEMKAGGVLAVLVDNEIAVQNLLKFAKQKGFEAVGEKKEDKAYQVVIIVASDKKDNAAMEISDNSVEDKMSDTACEADSRKKGMTVVLSANTMGTGDEKLGKALMKAFVFALTKQDKLPETILCYNTGAYLTCEDADTLEDMRALEAEGVNILTCGTCLDFYGIKDKLSVGSVTNMYEIVEKMEISKTIIRP